MGNKTCYGTGSCPLWWQTFTGICATEPEPHGCWNGGPLILYCKISRETFLTPLMSLFFIVRMIKFKQASVAHSNGVKRIGVYTARHVIPITDGPIVISS